MRRLLRGSSTCRALVVVIMAFHAILLGCSAVRQSPTWDEVGFVVAGVRHWQFGEFDLFRVNPPLVRLLASAPLVLAGSNVNWTGLSDHPSSRREFNIGQQFIIDDPHRAFQLFFIARRASIAFSLLGAWICFCWARELYGNRAGYLGLALWCFSPNILAHGQLMTCDVGAASLGAAAAYLFWHWLRTPTWTRAFFAGMVLGLAELTKFTLVVFFPLWPALWMVWRMGSPHPNPLPKGEGTLCPHPSPLPKGEGTVARPTWRRELGQLAVILLLAVYVINLGYGFEGSLKPLGDYQFVSQMFGAPQPSGDTASAGLGNRFAGTWLGAVPVPLPDNYLRGIDRQRLDFENKMWSYLRGEWRFGGWWYYYLYGLAIKEPVGTWVLIALALGVSVFGPGGSKAGRETGSETDKNVCPAAGYSGTGRAEGTDKNVCPPGAYCASWRDEIVLLAPLVVILTLVSSQTGFNHQLRYVLPIFPFAFIWMSKVARAVEFGWGRGTVPFSLRENRDSPRVHRGIACVAAVALLWSVGSSLYYYPHSLSYFNELVGGPTGGIMHLASSNTDWGQDLFYLKRWLDEHPEAQPLYLGWEVWPVDPGAAGISFTSPPRRGPEPGWYAMSVNVIRSKQGQFAYFLDFKPVAMAGYSIYIYHVTPEEANRARRELGLGGKDEG